MQHILCERHHPPLGPHTHPALTHPPEHHSKSVLQIYLVDNENKALESFGYLMVQFVQYFFFHPIRKKNGQHRCVLQRERVATERTLCDLSPQNETPKPNNKLFIPFFFFCCVSTQTMKIGFAYCF